MKKHLIRLLTGPLLLLGGLGGLCQLSAQTPMTDTEKKHPKVSDAEDHFRKNEFDKCYECLVEAANDKEAALPPARLMMARLYFSAQGQAQAGRVLLETALVESPDHPEVYLTNASIALAEGRILDTLLSCQIALQQANGARWNAAQQRKFRTEAHAGLATAYEARKDWGNSRSHLTEWSNLDPDNVAVRQRLARAHFLLGNQKDARAELTEAAKRHNTKKADSKWTPLDPTEVTMGQFHAQMVGLTPLPENKKNDKDIDKEIERIKKEDANHYAKAKECFEKAIKESENDPVAGLKANQAFAGWLLDNRKLKEAEDVLETVAKLDKTPPTRETQSLQGLLARYKKDYTTAANIFQRILAETRDDFFAGNQAALCLIEIKGDQKAHDRAGQTAETNQRLYPRAAEAYATLGWIYLQNGRVDEADRALAIAINSGQASADTAYYLSKLLMKKAEKEDGKKKTELEDRAKEILDKALKSQGVFVNREEAKEFLDGLKGTLPMKKVNTPPVDPKKISP